MQKDWQAVEPLIKTHWDQDEPYWDQTPRYKGSNEKLKGEQCLTGCSATALAQVVNYYRHPAGLPNGLPDYLTREKENNWRIDALPPVTFDWDNIINDYTILNPETKELDVLGTDVQRHAVATLMRYCGQAMKMSYGPMDLGSGTEEGDDEAALVNYLDYPAATFLKSRATFTVEEWERIIYGEVSAGRPVLYAGYYDGGGHEFVCDGYDGNGLFHINWGWSGICDGYYALSVLNPYASKRENVGSSHIGFSIGQCAVIYIDPALEKQPAPKGSVISPSPFYQQARMSLQQKNQIIFYYDYDGEDTKKATVDNALGTMEADGTVTPRFMGDLNDSIVYASNLMLVEIDSTAFQRDDSLTLHPLLRLRRPDAQWQVVPPLSSHVVAGRDKHGRFFIHIYGEHFYPECVGGSITKGTGRLNERNDLSVIVRNRTESDIYKKFQLVPIYYGHIRKENLRPDTPSITGSTIPCGGYIPAGEQSEVIFSFIPQQGGLIKFLLRDELKNEFGSFMLELTNDTLNNYDKYVENKSYFAQKDGRWYYNIELCDKRDTKIPYWIPSDQLRLVVNVTVDGDTIASQLISKEIRAYLKALPEKGGKGIYSFVRQVPIDMSRYGTYQLESSLGVWTDGTPSQESVKHTYTFPYNDPTGISSTISTSPDAPYHDLLGRPIQGIPQQPGIYIKGNKKVIITSTPN